MKTTEQNKNQLGYQTGIPKKSTTQEREFICICSLEEHLAGSNTKIGGNEKFKEFKKVKWNTLTPN